MFCLHFGDRNTEKSTCFGRCFFVLEKSVCNSGTSIAEKTCVGYKDELFVDILHGVIYAELLIDLNDNENHDF